LLSGSVCVVVPVPGANIRARTADWWCDAADVKVYVRCPCSFCCPRCSRLALFCTEYVLRVSVV